MAVIAHFTLPTEDFVFDDLLSSQSTIRLRLETMVPTGTSLVPYCWVAGGDVEAIRAALEDSPIVANARLLDRVEDQALFRIDWADALDGLFDAIQDAEAVLLECSATTDVWSIRLRFPDYDALTSFYRTCIEDDVDLTLERMHNPVEPGDMLGYGLTARQRETLLTALEAGYFRIPRETTLIDLSEHFGVSDVAASQRIRRGLDALISATLASESVEDSSGDG